MSARDMPAAIEALDAEVVRAIREALDSDAFAAEIWATVKAAIAAARWDITPKPDR